MVASKLSHGVLPASKEVVLEIQLNKLINDFFFASCEQKTSNESEDKNGSPVKSKDNVSSNNISENASSSTASPVAMAMHSSPFSQTTLCSPNKSNLQISTNSSSSEMQSCTDGLGIHSLSGFRSSAFHHDGQNQTPSITDRRPNSLRSQMPVRSEPNRIPLNSDASKCTVDDNSKLVDAAETVESVDFNVNVLKPKLSCFDSQRPPSTENVKAPRLTKSYSESGTMFYLSVETRRNASDSLTAEKGSIKLTRIGSMPNHQNHQSQSEQDVVKHTCRKPPRPPRSPSPKDQYTFLSRYPSKTILVVHSSRRAKLERRRRLAAASSSTASTWALVFTFFFAMVIIGEGFWNQRPEGVHSLTSGAVDAVSSSMQTQFNVDPLISSRNMRLQSKLKDLKQLEKEISDLHRYNQFEKEMQVRALWIAKRLDMEPT